MAYQCWTCGIPNPNKRALKNHAIASHKHLTVMCPYCPSDYTSTRISDLKRHCLTKHFPVEPCKDFFSEGNGFYLGMHPHEYIRHVRPSSITSPEALAAMMAIELAIPARATSSRSLADWKNGWGQAISTPTQENGMLSPVRAMSPTRYTPALPEGTSSASPYNNDDHGASKLYSPSNQGVPLYSPTIEEPLPEYTPTTTCSNGGLIHVDAGSCVIEIENDLYHAELLKSSDTALNGTFGERKERLLGSLYYDISKTISEVLKLSIVDIGRIHRVSSEINENLNMLSVGAMPLFPPARREWDREEVVTFINPVTRREISWPPKGWKMMRNSEKMLKFEYCAMMLDEDATGYPTTRREELHDTYNFLVLPRTRMNKPKGESLRRILNFSALRDVVKGNVHDDVLAEMLRRAFPSRKTSTDLYIQKCLNIKLRI